MICRTMIFYSFFVHYLISKNFWKIFKSIKKKTFRNRTSNLSKSDRLIIRIICFLRFRLIDISFFKKYWIQLKKCIIMLLNSWCKISIIMISWILIKKKFQTKFFVSWTHFSSREFNFSICCRRICSCMNSCVRNDQSSSRFFRAFDDTRQMIQCCSFFTSMINICSS
jgi:hypothetical protein